MALGRTALAVIVAILVTACGASGAQPSASVPPSGDAVTVSASPASAAGTSVAPSDVPMSPSPASTPRPSPTSTPVAEPPKPSGVSFDESRLGDDPTTVQITQSVRWGEPRSEGVEIQVYGVTECLAMPANPAPGDSGPCLVVRTPLPAAVRVLLATAPASDGVASWTWTGTYDCEIGLAYDPRGPAYHSVVLAAYGASDHSIFAIAEPGGWSQPGPDEVIC